MKVLQIALAFFGAFCACLPTKGQVSPRVSIVRFFPYEPQIQSPVFTFNNSLKLDLKNMWLQGQEVPVVAVSKPTHLKLKLVPEEYDVFLPPVFGQKDLIPNSLMRRYRNGFAVTLPFNELPTTVYIRGGLSWDVGKHSRLIFPSFSRFNGVKFTKNF